MANKTETHQYEQFWWVEKKQRMIFFLRLYCYMFMQDIKYKTGMPKVIYVLCITCAVMQYAHLSDGIFLVREAWPPL